MSELYPLLTSAHTVQPIWGGTRLAAWLALPEPRPERLGEIWLVYDSNPVTNGPLAGKTLAEVTRSYGAALVGTRTVARYGADFPLLAKFIDAADSLSIQVHPDDAYAHSREAGTGFHGKTEAWYILDAQEGADVVYGLEQPATREEFAAAIAGGALEPLMHRLPVHQGDTVFVPAGTVHAINAGIMLFEIQQKSNLTYRVYDYGRRDAKTGQPRELHIEKSLDVMEYGPPPRGALAPLSLGDGHDLLVACDLFALERWALAGEHRGATDPGTFEILTLLAGELVLEWAGGATRLGLGSAVVLPADLGAYTLHPETPDAQLLRVTVPDLERDYLEPLRAQDMPEKRIAETIIR